MNDRLLSLFSKYSRVVVALVLALLLSELMISKVFLGATPRVRPDLANSLVEGTLALINVDTYIAFFKGEDKNQRTYKYQLDQTAFRPTVIRGVYAKETENAGEVYVNINEVEWVKVPYVKKNGETVELNIPSGVEPPPPGMF